MNVPLVSVAMPTHEQPALLERAARSVLDHSGVDLELVMVDDRSAVSTPDGTARMAGTLPRLDGSVPRARYTATTNGTRRGNPALPSRVMCRRVTSTTSHPAGSR